VKIKLPWQHNIIILLVTCKDFIKVSLIIIKFHHIVSQGKVMDSHYCTDMMQSAKRTVGKKIRCTCMYV
jgi:hypothetical protein